METNNEINNLTAQLTEILKAAHFADLSMIMQEGMAAPEDIPLFVHTPFLSKCKGALFNSFNITFNEHHGTHIDAPLHRANNAESIDAISPLYTLLPCSIVKLGNYTAGEAVTASDIENWEKKHIILPPNEGVIIKTGWSEKLSDDARDKNRYTASWPGLSAEAAELIVKRGCRLVGLDSPSADPNPGSCNAHDIILENSVLLLENLCNLDGLPEKIFLIAIPLKIKNGTASPVRAIALW